jgi:hypothetical protein
MSREPESTGRRVLSLRRKWLSGRPSSLTKIQRLCGASFRRALNQLDANTFDINMGRSIPATGTLQTCSHPFTLPSPGKILKIEGTVVFRGECAGDTDTFVSVDGGAKQTYHMKQKMGTGGGVSTVFVSYDIPLSYSSPTASIEFGAFIPSFCPSNPDWEFKGVMQVKPQSEPTSAVSSTKDAARELLRLSRTKKSHSTARSDRIKTGSVTVRPTDGNS